MMTGILSQIVEFRNGESGLHVLHINILTQLLLEKLTRKSENYNFSWSQQHMIATASALHDIGKIGIDEKILNKPGKLTKEEFEAMKQHTIIGARMLDSLEMYHDEEMMKYAYEICRWHHERYDGKGYPDGLKGEEIPISAQVVSLADVYDAMISKRPYRDPMPPADVIEYIMAMNGSEFDPKLVELKLVPDAEAYKAEYYTFLMNGLMTQLVRIEPGNNIEEAHMRNRQLIARWVFEKGAPDKVVEMVKKDGKTYVVVNDYEKVRELFGELLAEIQRIKSTGDFEGARTLVENYAVKVDPTLHAEVLERYKKLNLAPYKGFINPVYELVTDKDGNITDVTVSYDEDYVEQMLRYSKDYSPLPSVNN